MEREMDEGGEGGRGRGCGRWEECYGSRRAVGGNMGRGPVQERNGRDGEGEKREAACRCEHRGRFGKTSRPAQGRSAGKARGRAWKCKSRIAV